MSVAHDFPKSQKLQSIEGINTFCDRRGLEESLSPVLGRGLQFHLFEFAQDGRHVAYN